MSRLKTDAIRNVNASVDGITLDTSGNVAIPNKIGINTTSPEDLLHIKTGKIRIENAIVSNNDSTISYDNDTFLVDVDPNNVRGSSQFQIKIDTVSGLIIDDNRHATFGGRIKINDFIETSVNNSNLKLNSAGSSGQIKFHINGSEKAKFDSSGNFQINNDSGKITVGLGADLQLFHDGGTSTIRNVNNNANLELQASSTGTKSIRCYPNSGVVLYWNGETNLYTAEDAVRIHDNIKLEMGNASDFSIFHHGTEQANYIEGTNNVLYICGKTGQTSIQITPDGPTDLRYSGSKKIETTSTGAIFTSGAAGTTSCRFGNTANRGLEIKTYNSAGNNDGGVILNAADTTTSGYHAVIAFQTGGEEKARFEGQYDNFRLSNTCSGITFNGDWAAQNRLNDYEEGTWNQTAVNLGDHSKHGDSHANYTKVGNLVTATFFYKWTSRSTNNGAYGVRVSMPFTAATLVIPGTGSCACESICLNNSDRTSFHTSIYSNTNLATFRASKHNDSEISFNGAISTSASAGYFAGTLSYRVS